MINPNSIISSTQAPLNDFLKKQRENKRFSNTVEMSITLFLISVFSLFAIKPAITTISALLGEIKSKEALTQKMRSKINTLVEAQDSFSQVQSQYHIIESSLPSRTRFSHLITQVQGTSFQSGVNLQKFNFNLNPTIKSPKDAKTVQNVNLKTYQLSLSELADFNSVTKFLDLLSQNRRLINISNFTLQTNKNTDPSDLVNPDFIKYSLTTDINYWQEANGKN